MFTVVLSRNRRNLNVFMNMICYDEAVVPDSPQYFILATKLQAQVWYREKTFCQGHHCGQGGLLLQPHKRHVFGTTILLRRLALVASSTSFSGISYSGFPSLSGSVLARSSHKSLFGCGSFTRGEIGIQRDAELLAPNVTHSSSRIMSSH